MTAIVAVLLTFGAARPVTALTEWQQASPEAQQAVVYALQQQGNTWRYGSKDPDRGLDCSGLVRYAYGRVGIELPASSTLQIRAVEHVDNLVPGDIVYYPRHVMLYIGSGMVVHSPGGYSPVQIDPLPDRDDLQFGRPSGGDEHSDPVRLDQARSVGRYR